jgi:hypothetical protein
MQLVPPSASNIENVRQVKRKSKKGLCKLLGACPFKEQPPSNISSCKPIFNLQKRT